MSDPTELELDAHPTTCEPLPIACPAGEWAASVCLDEWGGDRITALQLGTACPEGMWRMYDGCTAEHGGVDALVDIRGRLLTGPGVVVLWHTNNDGESWIGAQGYTFEGERYVLGCGGVELTISDASGERIY